jgi:hypothetical protein
VGFLAALRPGIGSAELTAAALIGPAAIRSPWAPPGNLEHIVLADVFGENVPEQLTRARAIRVPAVARARGIVCTTIARIELGDWRGTDRLPAGEAASWLSATDGAMSPLHRMLWTVDDLYFYGWSCWRVTARGTDGFPLRMDRIPMGSWELEPDTGRVLIWKPDAAGVARLQPAAAREVVLIPGPHEGLLVEGAPAVRHAADLQAAAHNAARFPSAYLGLKQPPGSQLLKRRSDDPTEVTVETIIRDWKAARLNPEGGGVAFLGGLDAQEIGTFAEHLVVDGRNAADVDVARHSYIPADLIDATISQSSLQYSTSRDNDRRAIDYGLGAYMSCISARLSQDDVHPRGRRVAFDLEQWLGGATPLPGATPAAAPAGGLPTPTPTPTGVETPQ